MCTERPHTIDRLTSFESAVPTDLRLNEYGINCYQQEEREAMRKLKRDLEFLRDRYNIRVRLSRGTKGDLKNVTFIRWTERYIVGEEVATLRTVLSKYPPEFIRGCEITQLRFVEALSVADNEYWEGNKTLGGLASTLGPVYIASGREDIIHHELFHRADQRSREMSEKKRRMWGKLNCLADPYLYEVYWDMPLQEQRELPIDGFASTYGRVDVLEDRATIAGLLMSDFKMAEKRFKEDKVLAGKAKRIMTDLRRWSGGRMNAEYFKDLKKGKVWEGYW